MAPHLTESSTVLTLADFAADFTDLVGVEATDLVYYRVGDGLTSTNNFVIERAGAPLALDAEF